MLSGQPLCHVIAVWILWQVGHFGSQVLNTRVPGWGGVSEVGSGQI